MLPLFLTAAVTTNNDSLLRQLNQDGATASAGSGHLPDGVITMLLSLTLVIVLISVVLKWLQPWLSGFYKSSGDPKNKIDLLSSQSMGGGQISACSGRRDTAMVDCQRPAGPGPVD